MRHNEYACDMAYFRDPKDQDFFEIEDWIEGMTTRLGVELAEYDRPESISEQARGRCRSALIKELVAVQKLGAGGETE